ncbi:competence/damage-inducible protein CinA [Bacillaceae bacterium]
MKAEIIAVGTELLLGQIANTNAQFISQKLAEIGVGVYFHTVVGDNAQRLAQAVEIARKRADLLIFTGGLGPTKDDLTKETVAGLIGRTLVTDEAAMGKIEAFFRRRGTRMTENNRKQALVIAGSRVLPNEVGLAPGMALTVDGKSYMLLPGPPRELMPMFETYGIPFIRSLFPGSQVFHSQVLRFCGIGESALEEQLLDLIESQTNPTIAPLAKEGEVTLRLTARAASRAEAERLLHALERQIRERVGRYIYGVNEDTLEKVVVGKLRERGERVSVAESCTGGLVSHLLTSVPGSSSAFAGSVVCYTNESKEKQLGVPRETLAASGAVSEETARLLAENVRQTFASAYGVSVTGVAGPETVENKPVGLVYIAVAAADGPTRVRRFHLAGNREVIQWRAAKQALYELWQRINARET